GQDVAGVVVVDSAPTPLFPRLSANLSGLRTELSRLEPTHVRADWGAAFATAGRLLADHAGPRRVFVLSDLQRSNWSDWLTGSMLSDSLPHETVVAVVGSTTPAAANIALSRPRHFPALPLIGEEFDVTVHVSNHSDQTQQVQLQCQRTSDDGTDSILGDEEQTVSLSGREHRDVSFRVSFLESDRITVHLKAATSDALPVDDECWLVVETTVRTPVVVLSDDDPNTPGSAAYYLTRALAPARDAASRFAPRHLRSSELTGAAVESAPVVVCGYLGALSDESAGVLARFVRDGGGLVVFSGEGPVDRNLQTLQSAFGAVGGLPWEPGPRRMRSRTRPPWNLAGGRWHSRWLRAFDDQSQLVLQQIQFDRTWGAGAISPAAEVLLTYDDGTPALGMRSIDRGLLVVASFSPESTTSDLARHGAFVAFAQMLVRASIPESAEPNRPALGQPWTWSMRFPESAATTLTASGPDGAPVILSSRQEADELLVSMPPLKRPGLYRLFLDGKPVASVAATIDEHESDLSRLAPAEVEQRLSATGHVMTESRHLEHGAAPLRGRPLWGAFFAAALTAVGLEMFLLGWWRR
ncbi:MAG: hypothetical protein KDA75_12600, partial [Planctomycetaceae bacterium]|nr:hypothetical protein [Planctomycetaceae bacterium]